MFNFPSNEKNVGFHIHLTLETSALLFLAFCLPSVWPNANIRSVHPIKNLNNRAGGQTDSRSILELRSA